jgi:hypothetical protein
MLTRLGNMAKEEGVWHSLDLAKSTNWIISSAISPDSIREYGVLWQVHILETCSLANLLTK